MKRVLFRFCIALFLLTGSVLFYLDRPVHASGDCGMAVYNKWMSCDNAYANTVQTYAIRTPYCEQNAPSYCPNQSQEATCQSNCSQNPNPTACYDSCCLAASRTACEATVTANYGNR